MSNSYTDLAGQRFGRLVAIQKVKPHITSGGAYITMWECKCDCGNTTTVSMQKLKTGHTQSCGCNKKNCKGGSFKDLTGKRFGRLTVIKYLQENEREKKRKCWLCRCDCGNVKTYSADKIISGSTHSCGCEMIERIGRLNRKYIYSCKRLYGVYAAMKERCCNSKNEEYHNYGARGIIVCQEWLESFDNFAEWSFANGYNKNAPRGQCTLDRINNDKGYSPDNCRWITNKENCNNMRKNVLIEYNGNTYTMSQLANELSIPYRYFSSRYARGKTIEQILDDYTAYK